MRTMGVWIVICAFLARHDGRAADGRTMGGFLQSGHLRSLFWLTTLSAVLLISGCAQPAPYREEAFRSMELDMAKEMRPLGPPGRALGLSQKARDVERNLGVQ